MFYKLLGMIVWKGGKRFIKRRYGKVVQPVATGALLAVLLALALGVVAWRRGEHGGD